MITPATPSSLIPPSPTPPYPFPLSPPRSCPQHFSTLLRPPPCHLSSFLPLSFRHPLRGEPACNSENFLSSAVGLIGASNKQVFAYIQGQRDIVIRRRGAGMQGYTPFYDPNRAHIVGERNPAPPNALRASAGLSPHPTHPPHEMKPGSVHSPAAHSSKSACWGGGRIQFFQGAGARGWSLRPAPGGRLAHLAPF